MAEKKKKEIKSKSKNIKQKQKQTQIVNVNIEQKNNSKKRKYTKKTTNNTVKGIPTTNTLFKYQQSNKAPIIMPPILNNNELISEMKNILQVHNQRIPIQTTNELMRQQTETTTNLNNLVRQQNAFETPIRLNIEPNISPYIAPNTSPEMDNEMTDMLLNQDAQDAIDSQNKKRGFLNRALNFASILSPFSKKPEKPETNRGRPPDLGLAFKKYTDLGKVVFRNPRQKKEYEAAERILMRAGKIPQPISHIV